MYVYIYYYTCMYYQVHTLPGNAEKEGDYISRVATDDFVFHNINKLTPFLVRIKLNVKCSCVRVQTNAMFTLTKHCVLHCIDAVLLQHIHASNRTLLHTIPAHDVHSFVIVQPIVVQTKKTTLPRFRPFVASFRCIHYMFKST